MRLREIAKTMKARCLKELPFSRASWPDWANYRTVLPNGLTIFLTRWWVDGNRVSWMLALRRRWFYPPPEEVARYSDAFFPGRLPVRQTYDSSKTGYFAILWFQDNERRCNR